MKDRWWLPASERYAAMAYCRRYKELCARYHSLDGLRGVAYDGDPVQGEISDPTERIAARRLAYDRALGIIEDAARFASPSLEKWVLLYITDRRMTFERLREKGFPLGKNILTKLARKAYWKVAQRI